MRTGGSSSSGDGATSPWCSLDFEVAVGARPGRVEDVDEAAQCVGGAAAHAVVRGQHPVPGPGEQHQHGGARDDEHECLHATRVVAPR